MKAGRELDALVAEKVMGWNCELRECHTRKVLHSEYGGPPHYSTDIADAWLVVEKIDQQVTVTKCADGWLVTIDDYFCHGGVEIMAGTAPLAICLAALKAVGVDITDNNAT